MSSTSETPIEYKSYSIQKDQRNPYGSVEFMYYPTEQGVQHDADYDGEQYKYTGNCAWASTIEEAKSEIDERIAEQESKRPIPSEPMTIGGEDLELQVIYNAVHHRALRMNLENEHDANEFMILSKWSAAIIQALKDQKFESTQLPFPEK